ncbi:aminopeptidase [Thermotoga caldifontis]|uniref:aminopeptidase n=1 Tax=Thermotoga caldifontis TaxID=1508419 RepID=UPI000596C7C0|nr:aminopeptidase [Thermotoga caldifontis]
MDQRWEKLGDILVHYSTEISSGENVLILMWEIDSFPLAQAIYKSAVESGANVQVLFLSETFNRLLLKYGRDQQIDWLPDLERYGMDWADVCIELRAASNPSLFWDIPDEKVVKLRKTRGEISTLRWQNTRWCLLRLPTPALAQQAGLDENTLIDMFFNACFLDWPSLAEKWREWASILNRGKFIRVRAKDTDLSFSIEGRSWSVDDAHINMPGGEISTAPVESSVNGYIYFDTPTVFAGKLMQGVYLVWRDGELVEAKASTNEDFLKGLVKTDEGASKIGEFAIGTNPKLYHFCHDLLLDEKIYGTIHIALGRAYPKVGGTNRSVIHWDIVKDLRQQGEIYLDGELIFKNGEILL